MRALFGELDGCDPCGRFDVFRRVDSLEAGDVTRGLTSPARLVGALLRYDLRQRGALDKLHRVVVHAPLAADGIDRDDAGVMQSGGGAGLVLEAFELAAVEHAGQRQHFEGDAATERKLLGFVDDSHAAATDLAHDAKVAEQALGRWVFVRRCRDRLIELGEGVWR